jgi:hypothetical protein
MMEVTVSDGFTPLGWIYLPRTVEEVQESIDLSIEPYTYYLAVD